MDQKYAVEFAKCNRKLMISQVEEIIAEKFSDITFSDILDTPHNFVSREYIDGEITLIHRKGAAPANKDQLGIIPGSQGTKSYITKGLGNFDSYCTSSHGAGRKLSRTVAINKLNLEEELKLLEDQGIIHSIRGKQDLDEAPGAYKDISEVLNREKDIVEIVEELSPIAVLKG